MLKSLLKAFEFLFPKSTKDELRKKRTLISFKLLQQEDVQNELGLDVEQRGAFLRRSREVRQSKKTELASLATLPPEERRRGGMRLLNQAAVEVMEFVERERLLSSSQRDRLQQLSWRRQGPQAFSDPRVFEALRLTAGQQELILDLLDSAAKQARSFEDDGIDPTGGRTTLRREVLDRILAILDEGQRKKWEALLGPPLPGEREPSEAPASESPEAALDVAREIERAAD